MKTSNNLQTKQGLINALELLGIPYEVHQKCLGRDLYADDFNTFLYSDDTMKLGFSLNGGKSYHWFEIKDYSDSVDFQQTYFCGTGSKRKTLNEWFRLQDKLNALLAKLK